MNTLNKLYQQYYFLISIGLLIWITSLLFGSVLCYIIHFPINSYTIWLINFCFLISFSIYLIKSQQLVGFKQLFSFWGFFAGIVLLVSLFVSFFYDFSYDGQAYHGLATIYLNNGWNPFLYHLSEDGVNNIYINHYTQGSWIAYNAFYTMFGNFETAKMVNLLMMFSVAGICYDTFQKLKIVNSISHLYALLIAFHPVCLNMFLGMCIDGQLSSCIMIIIAIFIQWHIGVIDKTRILILIVALAFLINIKFTGLIFALFFCGCFGFVLLFEKRLMQNLKFISIIAIGIFIATSSIGYPSYVRNTIEHNYPFYPLHHTTTQKSVLSIEPSSFSNQNRFLSFGQSLFAKTGYSNYYFKPIQYKIPFSISKYELERYAFSGVMIGGLGVWFGYLFCIGLVFLIITFIYDTSKQRKRRILILVGIVFASAFVLEAPWWARYAPQIYLIPIISILYFNFVFSKQKIIFFGFSALFIINSTLILLPYIGANFMVTQKVKKQYQELKQTNQTYFVDFRNSQSQRVRFDRYQIPIIEISSSEFPDKKFDTIFQSEVVFYPAYP